MGQEPMPPENIEQLRDQLLQNLQRDPLSVTPIIETLRANTDENRFIDPRNEDSEFQTWMPVYGVLLKGNLLHQAAEVVSSWYDCVSQLQVQNGKRYHKGGASHNYGFCFLQQGDYAGALWYLKRRISRYNSAQCGRLFQQAVRLKTTPARLREK